MSDVQNVVPILPAPGIQRDGTNLDIRQLGYIDGQWVRFQRGRPRKIGGYIRITDRLSAPIRLNHVTPYNSTARVLSFSIRGIETVLVDSNGLGANIIDRTPSGFDQNEHYLWSIGEIYDDAAGGEDAIVLAVAVEVDSTDTTNVGQVYYGKVFEDTAFAEVSGVTARGLFVTQPYVVYFGLNGSVTWSNANEPFNITTGDAGSDRVTGTTIVAGLPLPTGSGPGGILISLDSVIRMEYVGGQAIFRFTKITSSSSILTQTSLIELDGVYYWVGNDKFYVSDGTSVKVLPNDTNLNWFFDNLNRQNSGKVWAAKNTKFNEIMWFFPYGDNEECSHAVVYNAKDNFWFDFELSRSAGSNYYEKPIKASPPTGDSVRFTLTNVTGDFAVGDIFILDTSLAKYKIVLIDDTVYYADKIIDGEKPVAGSVITNQTQTGEGEIVVATETASLYLHEFGLDRIEGNHAYAIPSSFTTSSISLLSSQESINRWTRVMRFEPDFIQSGQLALSVITKEFANSDEVTHGPYRFTEDTEKVDIRLQGRYINIKIESNEYNGDYQLGKCLIHMEPGDVRN